MNLDTLLTSLKRHGATGVIALWLLITYNKTVTLEKALLDCVGGNKSTSDNKQPAELPKLALLPKKIKVIEYED